MRGQIQEYQMLMLIVLSHYIEVSAAIITFNALGSNLLAPKS
jgi:hypothetical protein